MKQRLSKTQIYGGAINASPTFSESNACSSAHTCIHLAHGRKSGEARTSAERGLILSDKNSKSGNTSGVGGVFHLPNLSNQLQQSDQVSQRAGFKRFAVNAVWDTFGGPIDLADLFFTLRHKIKSDVRLNHGCHGLRLLACCCNTSTVNLQRDYTSYLNLL